MASINRRTISWMTKGGEKRTKVKYEARYRDPDGKQPSKLFDRKKDAQTWLDQQTAALVSGDYVDPQAGKETVRAYASRWEAIQVSSTATATIRDNALRLHILPRIGTMRLRDVRRSDVQSLVKHLEGKGLAAGSVRNIYDVTARLFSDAVEDRLISRTPCTKITLPKGDGEEVVPPTVEQVEAVRDALDEHWCAVVTVLAGSGLRIGELLGLTVGDVDFLRRVIRVERQRLQSNELAPLKTKGSRRTVPVGQVVVDALAAYLAAHNPQPDIEADVRRWREGALFVDELGRPLTYRRWKALLRVAAGEQIDDVGNVTRTAIDVTSHGFRHFAASALISGGASVKQVQAFLGHASAVITLRTYAHLFPGDDDRTRNVLDAALAPLATDSSESRAQ